MKARNIVTGKWFIVYDESDLTNQPVDRIEAL